MRFPQRFAPRRRLKRDVRRHTTAVATRNRFLSALFGFLVPGLGHVYIGRALRFSVFAVAYFAIVLGLGLAGFLSTFWGQAVYVGLLLTLYLFSIVEPPIVATRKPFEPRWYNRWYGYIGWIALAVIALSVIPLMRESILGFAVFRVPGGAMVPAIEPRDIVLVDTRAFVNRAPVANEVVIVRGPQTGLLYVRRVRTQPGSVHLTLIRDNPEPSRSDLELARVPVSEAIGKVTYVFFSANAARIGRRVE